MQSNSDVSRWRVLVGYLGEHRQANWWSSSFLGRSSEAFLTPIFGNAVANARVVGVTEAARRVHDDAIGVGRTFHLFRLPETLEQELHRTLSTSKGIPELVDAAIEEMRALLRARTSLSLAPFTSAPCTCWPMRSGYRSSPAIIVGHCLGRSKLSLFHGLIVDVASHYSIRLNAGLGLVPETGRLLELWQVGTTAQTLLKAAMEFRRFSLTVGPSPQKYRDRGVRPAFPDRGSATARILKAVQGRIATADFRHLLLIYTCRANPVLADFIRDVVLGKVRRRSSFRPEGRCTRLH